MKQLVHYQLENRKTKTKPNVILRMAMNATGPSMRHLPTE